MSYTLQPLALAVVIVRIFRAVAYARVCSIIVFCLVSSKNFNIMSALSAHHPPTLLQIIDSRESSF